jgi:P22 coat protein - gene protein 5
MKKLLLSLLRSTTFTTGLSLAVGALVTYVLGQFSQPVDGVSYADNTLLTISMITREALRILENNLAFTKRVNRQYDDKFAIEGAKIGYVVNARKPVRYIVATGQALQLQDATETQVPVSLTTQDHVDFQFSSADLKLSIDDFGDRFVQPAVAALANKIDYNGLQLYKQIYNSVSSLDAVPPVTPIATPTSLLVYLMAGVMLDNNAAPQDEMRHLVITPKMQAFIVDALKGLFQQSTQIAQQYMKGQMGTAGGFQWAMDQNCPTHVSGTFTTAGSVAAGLTGASIPTGATTAWVGCTLKAGDIVTFPGVYSVNPQSRQSTGQLQQFTLTSGVSSATTPTLNISPPIITSGPNQTVSNATTAGTVGVLTLATGSSNPIGLAFHRDAFTLVTADLPVPKGTDMASRVSDKQLGISLRIVRDYDITTDQFPCRIDVLYGWATLRPELACRVYSA